MDENNIHQICRSIEKTLIHKNSDYGGSFEDLVDKYNEFPFLIHAEEKLGRIRSTSSNEANFESTYDSLLDLAGYCVLYADILLRKENEN